MVTTEPSYQQTTGSDPFRNKSFHIEQPTLATNGPAVRRERPGQSSIDPQTPSHSDSERVIPTAPAQRVMVACKYSFAFFRILSRRVHMADGAV